MHFIYGNNKIVQLINKEARRTLTEMKGISIVFIYKILQHFLFKSHLDCILNAFLRSPSSQIFNTNDGL